MNCVELKIKAKHLAVEPGIIRNEEKKLQKQLSRYVEKNNLTGNTWDWYAPSDDVKMTAYRMASKIGSLQHHRRDRCHKGLRVEARATHLARAFIAGKKYSTVEHKRREENEGYFQVYVLPRVAKMVTKYDKNRRTEQKNVELIREWLEKG